MADEHYMAALANALGTARPTLDAEGCCFMALAPDMPAACRCLPQMGVINVAVPLGWVLASTKDRLYVTLMLTNRYLGEQADAHFALSSDASRVVLCRALQTTALDPRDLAPVLQRLAAAASDYRQRLAADGLITH